MTRARMVKKKPCWISESAHMLLKAYCEQIGKTQTEVVSALIEKELEQAPAVEDRVFGGVWIV